MEPLQFLTSADTINDRQDLLTIRYSRVQKDSPEFSTVYEGIGQNIDIKISTVIVQAAPEPVVTLYDFIMTTFVPPQPDSSDGHGLGNNAQTIPDTTIQPSSDTIRVQVYLASVQGISVR